MLRPLRIYRVRGSRHSGTTVLLITSLLLSLPVWQSTTPSPPYCDLQHLRIVPRSSLLAYNRSRTQDGVATRNSHRLAALPLSRLSNGRTASRYYLFQTVFH